MKTQKSFYEQNGGTYTPEGEHLTANKFVARFSDTKVSGTGSTTLSIENVSAEMNGWGSFCVFRYKGQVASTSTAYIGGHPSRQDRYV